MRFYWRFDNSFRAIGDNPCRQVSRTCVLSYGRSINPMGNCQGL